jgi:hypothetical protein
MKKISFFALATLFGLNLMAQKSNVVVFSEDGDAFYAFLNGIKQNTTAQSNVRITDIPGQAASLRIVFANSGDEPVKKNLMLDPTGMEHTLKLKKDKKGAIKMQYFGSVDIAQSTSTAPAVAYTATEAPVNTATANTGSTGTVDNSSTYTMNTQVDNPSMSGTQNTSTSGNGTYSVNTQVSDPTMSGSTQTVTTTTTTNSSTTGTNGNENVNLSIGVGANGMNMSVNVSGSGTGDMNSGNVSMNTGMNMNGTATTSQTVTTTTTTSSSSSGTYSNTTYSNTDPAYNNATYNTNTTYNTTTDPNTSSTTTYNNTTTASAASGGCFYAMDDASFAKMKSTVEKVDFSDTRMSTAQTATRNNCLSTDQVKTMMDLFDMDDDKLAYAKFAYDYTLDKNNFYTLGEALTFDGNKNALNQFIESKR